jgi:undecaprenyl-diphosphatase
VSVVFQVIVLGIVQGLTEFLPISSSAHLILVPWLFGWQQLGLVFDVSLHVGTLLALLVYFAEDWMSVLRQIPALLAGKAKWSESQLVILALGTLPGAIFGVLAKDFIESNLRTPLVVVSCLIGFGILLWIADVAGSKTRPVSDARASDGLWIGLFQMLAVIPGVSRSGVTITAGLFKHFRSWDAARISFLLSAPLIAGAAIFEGRHAYHEYMKGALSTDPLMRQPHAFGLLLLGIVVSAVSGSLCIRYFLRYLQKGTLIPFVIYRVLLGLGILAAAAFGMPVS